MLEILFGIIAGIVTGLGVGGGTILILLLSLFLNMEQHMAQATNLIFFIPTAISAIIVNIRQKNIDYSASKIIIIFGVIGSILGSFIAQRISSNSLRKLFAIFILIIAVYEIYKLYIEYIKLKKEA